MRSFAILLAGLLFAAVSIAAQAQTATTTLKPEDAPFKDWLTLVDYMRSQGLEPTTTPWEVIDPMCLGLKQTGNEVPFNRCKFEKAQNHVLHGSDRDGCVAQAQATYPDMLLVGEPDDEHETPHTPQVIHNGRTTIYEHSHTKRLPISRHQLDSLRYGAISACMSTLGWNNADNWTLGRRPVPVMVPVPAY